MKLFYAPGACSLATHILLREGGFDFQLDKVDMKMPNRMTEEGKPFLEITPKSYVPALRMDDGEILQENVVIHSYLADLKPEKKLAPAHGTKARLRQDELAVYISTEIHKTYSPLFRRGLTDEAKAGIFEKLLSRYALVEKLLSDGRPYLTGENFATVDAYLFTVTRWGERFGVDFPPHVRAFQKRVAERPAVKAALEAEGLLKAA